MSEFQALSPQSDYTISSADRTSMDDVSLSSHSRHQHPPSGGGASVSSKFSRASRKSMKKSELGVPLTSASSMEQHDDDDDEENNGSSAGDWVGASAAPPPPPPPLDSPNKQKSYISEDDPFHIFRTDLVQKLSLVESELHRYLNTVQTTDTAVNTHQIKEIKKQLKRSIKHAESTLGDLETTVRVVEKQREKFPHINDVEIGERRGFVDDSRSRIASAKSRMQGEDVKQKFVRDERALTERRRGAGGSSSNSRSGGPSSSPSKNGTINGTKGQEYTNVPDLESGGDDSERSETLLMMQQQDETLDDLDMAVTRVGYMAETIHEEIDTQNVMLKNLEDDLADAEEQLGVVMGKLAKLLKTKSKCQIGLIVILSLIVLVLFFLVIYT